MFDIRQRLLSRRMFGLLVVLIGTAVWVQQTRPFDPSVDSSLLTPQVTSSPEGVMPAPTSAPPVRGSKSTKAATKKPTEQPSCKQSGSFVPVSAIITHVDGTVTVIGAERDSHGTPGTPPLTNAGKRMLAWDMPGVRPGSSAGNVLLNAHTWPDGSALGNTMLKNLQLGDNIVLRGANGEVAKYRVSQRLEVSVANYPQDRVYASGGSPQLVITACSGLRIGPGDWVNRTLWFATPVCD